MIKWKEPKYNIITTIPQLELLCDKIKTTIEEGKPISIDVETAGPVKKAVNPFYCWLLGFSIAVDVNEGWYIPIQHTKNSKKRDDQLPMKIIVEYLNPVLSAGGVYIGHNIKFDYKFLWRAGIYLYPCLWDTMSAIKLIDNRKPRKLKELVKLYIYLPYSKLVQTFEEASKGNAAEIDPIEFCTYAIDDVIFTYYLYNEFKPIIDSEYSKLFYDIESPLTPILAQMELKGIKIDANYYSNLKKPLENLRIQLKKDMQEQYDTSISSPKQIGNLFQANFSPIWFKRSYKTQAIVTDVNVLKSLVRKYGEHYEDDSKENELANIARNILKFRGTEKALSTYINKYPNVCEKYYDGDNCDYILHTVFDQIKNSGRLSSSPNIQNIPKDNEDYSVREGFIAREGYKFIEADWSSAELRLIAIASQDPQMLKLFMDNPRDADLHSYIAREMFGIKGEVPTKLRNIAKTLNFATAYGITAYSVAEQFNCTENEANQYMEKFFETCPKVREWKKEVEVFIRKNGYTSTFWGRKRYLPIDISPYSGYRYETAVRELINHIIQGSCADLLKDAMVKITKRFAVENLDSYIITSTHDSTTSETNDNIILDVSTIIKNEMERTINGILMPVNIEVKGTLAKVA
jgi:DNA polymerase-1